MKSELIVLSKEEFIEMFEGYAKRTSSMFERLEKLLQSQTLNTGTMGVAPLRRLFSKEIKKIMGLSQASFERNLHKLPIHQTESGRYFCYEHDLMAHLCKEHPPYEDITQHTEQLTKESLIKHLSGSSDKE